MWWSISIGHMVAFTWRQVVLETMLVFDDKPACDNEDDMTLVAPVVGNVLGAVIDQAKLNVSNLAHPHCRVTLFARMHGRRNL